MSFDAFVFGFYHQLRQKGIPLTFDQYGLMLDAVRQGLGMAASSQIMETCCLLWAKNRDEKNLIETEFKIYHKTTFERLARENKPQQPAPPSPRSEQKKEEDPDKQEQVQGGDKPDTIEEESSTGDSQKKSAPKEYTEQDAPTIAYYPPEGGATEMNELNAQLYDPDKHYIQSPYILSDDYLPISLRQAQQIWRGLRSYASSRMDTKINWAKTVQHIAIQGVFTRPVYERVRENRIKLVILIDHHGSMVPHWALGQHLVRAALEDGGHADALVYYTHNLPLKYLYNNPGHTQDVPLETVFAQCAAQYTTFLIFSDAGASRGIYNPQRVIATKGFLEKLKKHTKSVVWLNPMPRSRWEDTSAEIIQYMVPMFECIESDVEAAIRTLKTGGYARI